MAALLSLPTRTNQHDDIQSDQGSLIVAEAVTFAAATLFFVLRIISRRVTGDRLWWDDLFAIASYLTNWGWLAAIILMLKEGIGFHLNDFAALSGKSVVSIVIVHLRFMYINEFIYAFSSFFGKTSIICFYWRVFGMTNIGVYISVLAGVTITWIMFRTFMGIFQCVPISNYWDPEKRETCQIHGFRFFFATTLTHVLIDICILCLPAVKIGKLQLSLARKTFALVLFMFGVVVCVAGIGLVVSARQLDFTDLTWSANTIAIWSSIEVNFMSISASMPVSLPAVRFILNCFNCGSILSTSKTSASGSTPHTSRLARSRSQKAPTHLEADEAASTYELANSINHASDHELDLDVFGKHTTRVTAKSGGHSRDGDDIIENPFGIIVKNDTMVVHHEPRTMR